MGPTSSTSSPYNGLPAVSHSITNTDNETSGVTLSTTSLLTSEVGSDQPFTVKLDTKPSGDVTILLRSSDPGEGIPSPESLVFTASNFGTTQTVNVKPVDDNLLDGSQNYKIELLSISGTGTGYDGYDASDVGVTNSDNEEGPAGIYAMATDNETSEDGDTGIIKVRLNCCICFDQYFLSGLRILQI